MGTILFLVAVGYLLGSFNSAIVVSKVFMGYDIRTKGSGNAGLTNSYRCMGTKPTVFVLLGDIAKAVIASVIGSMMMGSLGVLIAGCSAIIGHMFPLYFRFKGGKGIATSSGVMLALDIRIGLLGLIGFFLIFFTTRYVSVGSLYMSLAFPIGVLIFYPGQWHLFGISVVFWLMAWMRHRENIKRLLKGTENRFERKKKN